MSELAREAGVNVATISRWESGVSQPCLPELHSALKALKTDTATQHRVTSLVEAPRATMHLRSSLYGSSEAPFEWSPSAGGLLRALRLRRGMTQEDVARKAGITQSTLSRWEHNEGWPSATDLEKICRAVNAFDAEFTALSCNPKTLAPVYSEQKVSLEEMYHWTLLVVSNAVNGTEPNLSELHFWQLLSTLISNYKRWQDQGSELLSIVFSRLSQWYLQTEFGGMGYGKPNRISEAAYFSHLSLKLDGRQGAATSSVILAQAACMRNGPSGVAKSLEILKPWSERRIGEAGVWHSNQIPADYASWIYREIGMYLSLNGQEQEALLWSRDAMRVAQSAMRPIEARLRRNDHAEMLLRSGDPDGAMDLLETRPPLDERILAWESILRAEAYMAYGDFDTARELCAEVSPIISMHWLNALARRAHSIENRAKNVHAAHTA